MKNSEKDIIKKELIEWLRQVDDSETLNMVKEVKAVYQKPDSYSKPELEYIKAMLQKSEGDIKAGRVVDMAKLNELFDR